MSRVFPISLHARSGIGRLALACGAVALLVAGAAAPASAATVLSTAGQVGGISLVDTAADPGVTCTSARNVFIPGQPSRLTSLVLHGPTVRPFVTSAGDGAYAPALVSVDFRVYQPLLVNGQPAGSRLVLSAVHQVLATSPNGTRVPDHTFDAGGLPNGRYTAQIVVTYKSTDQASTYGSAVIGYDFYKSTVSEYSPLLGRVIERVVAVGSAC